jgi:hypothetical protein
MTGLMFLVYPGSLYSVHTKYCTYIRSLNAFQEEVPRLGLSTFTTYPLLPRY